MVVSEPERVVIYMADSPRFTEMLKCFTTHPYLDIVGHALDSAILLKQLPFWMPDTVVIGEWSLSSLERLLQQTSSIITANFIVVVTNEPAMIIAQGLAIGASGYLNLNDIAVPNSLTRSPVRHDPLLRADIAQQLQQIIQQRKISITSIEKDLLDGIAQNRSLSDLLQLYMQKQPSLQNAMNIDENILFALVDSLLQKLHRTSR